MKKKRAEVPADSGFPLLSRFLIKIHPLEYERGVLIPGHRLEPFRRQDTLPWDVTLEGPAKTPFKVKKIGFPFDSLIQFNSLFGHRMSLTLLALDEESNVQALGSANDPSEALVRISVFDMADFYKESGISAKDYLLATLIDGSGTRFSIEGLKAGTIDPATKNAWLEKLAEGFKTAMIDLGAPGNNLELIRRAYLAVPRTYLETPSGTLGELLASGKAIALHDFAGDSFIWGKGVDITDSLGEKRRADNSEGLDGLLEELGLSLDSSELEAFARDELSRGGKVETALDRCYVSLEDLGYAAKDIKKLRKLSLELVEGIAKSYDAKADRRVAPVRRELLAYYERFVIWMRDLGLKGFEIGNLPREPFESLIGLMRELTGMIVFLNDPGSLDEDTIKSLSNSLADLHTIIDEHFDALDIGKKVMRDHREATATKVVLSMPEARKRTRTKGKKDTRPPARKAFFVDAKLENIDPPIHRTIVVPGNRTLADLHEILQTAFGWTNSHMHSFTIHGISYGRLSKDFNDSAFDESMNRLDDLSLRTRSRIAYVYDFGDDWRHDIRVAKVVPASEAEAFPVCVDGERSGPLEDCGGIPGYEELLAVHSADPATLDDDQKELIDWSYDWDPEAFGIEAINAILAKM